MSCLRFLCGGGVWLLRDRGCGIHPDRDGWGWSGAWMSERRVIHTADVVLVTIWRLWDHMFLGHVRASFLLAYTAIVGIVSCRDGTGGLAVDILESILVSGTWRGSVAWTYNNLGGCHCLDARCMLASLTHVSLGWGDIRFTVPIPICLPTVTSNQCLASHPSRIGWLTSPACLKGFVYSAGTR